MDPLGCTSRAGFLQLSLKPERRSRLEGRRSAPANTHRSCRRFSSGSARLRGRPSLASNTRYVLASFSGAADRSDCRGRLRDARRKKAPLHLFGPCYSIPMGVPGWFSVCIYLVGFAGSWRTSSAVAPHDVSSADIRTNETERRLVPGSGGSFWCLARASDALSAMALQSSQLRTTARFRFGDCSAQVQGTTTRLNGPPVIMGSDHRGRSWHGCALLLGSSGDQSRHADHLPLLLRAGEHRRFWALLLLPPKAAYP